VVFPRGDAPRGVLEQAEVEKDGTPPHMLVAPLVCTTATKQGDQTRPSNCASHQRDADDLTQ